MSKYKVKNNRMALIAGGGTGGHLFPGIAIGDALQKNGYNVRYIGSKHGLEATIFSKLNKKYYLLNIKGFQRTFSFKNIINNLLFPFRFLIAYYISKVIIKRIKPDIVIGTGGYASGIPLLSSIRMNIKTLIHEQNSYPGFTTRKLANKVNKVCITTNESNKYLNGNLILTGLPIRNNLISINKEKACKKLGLSINKKIVFILGGSQGSYAFNSYFKETFNFYLENNFQLIWQCGIKNITKYKKMINNDNILLKGFFNDISVPYSAADIIISRAGAVAINEISFIKKPMILIPLPTSAGNHQFHNAYTFSNNQAAIMINESELKNNIIENKILELFNNKQELQKLALNANNLIVKDATNRIINEIKELDYSKC
jgi:UDP-N-acetylglucosamine--N-acetylmuramyl-(pentapeptide) pyrophosphoryl-undecaprenol N-acetylglucosamine transferase